MKFVIIGGDAAGMSAASRAKRNNPDMDVIVFERTNDVSYSACGMPYNIADKVRSMNDLVVRSASAFREKQDIDVRLGYRVDSIDPKSKSIKGKTANGNSFFEEYDKLLIATGAVPIIPQIDGFDLPGVMTLKSLQDGRRMKDMLANVKKVVIVGIGYIAMEMAESLTARDIQVEMIKPNPTFLPWLASPLSERVRAELLTHDIRLLIGHEIKQIKEHGKQLEVVCDGLNLVADMVLVATGVKPNSQLAIDAGLTTGQANSISVNMHMRTSDKDIYAAGDCADAYHIVSGKRVWIPLALVANRGGWIVADNVIGRKAELTGIVGTAVFKVFDLEVARTGLTVDEAKEAGFDPVSVSIESSTRAHAHPGASIMHVHMVGDKVTGRLLGVQIVSKDGAAHRINAPAVALHANLSVEQFLQTDMAYAPPFGPVWDPMLTAANQLIKQL